MSSAICNDHIPGPASGANGQMLIWTGLVVLGILIGFSASQIGSARALNPDNPLPHAGIGAVEDWHGNVRRSVPVN
jgi:hypothetical protein